MNRRLQQAGPGPESGAHPSTDGFVFDHYELSASTGAPLVGRGPVVEAHPDGGPDLKRGCRCVQAEEVEVVGPLAWREAGPVLGWRYNVYQQWGQDKMLAEGDTFDQPFRELAADRFIIGTPEECVETCRRYEREMGVNYHVVRLNYVGMSFEAKVRQIRLFGEGVIPHFKGNSE